MSRQQPRHGHLLFAWRLRPSRLARANGLNGVWDRRETRAALTAEYGPTLFVNNRRFIKRVGSSQTGHCELLVEELEEEEFQIKELSFFIDVNKMRISKAVF